MDSSAEILSLKTRYALSLVVLFCLMTLLASPSLLQAATASGAGNETIKGAAAVCTYDTDVPCAFFDEKSQSTVTGVCIGSGICKAERVTTITGQVISVLNDSVMTAFKGLIVAGITVGIKSLFGFGNPTTNQPSVIVNQSPCPSGRYQTGTITADPCAIYIPPSSSQIPQGTANQLLNSLGAPKVSDTLLKQATQVQTSNFFNPNPAPPPTISPQSGAMGDIQLSASGATIQAGALDANANKAVAGFFGAKIIGGGAPQSLVERMCAVRPWQNPLLIARIPAALFDGLCAKQGVRVGLTADATSPPAQTTAANPPVTLTQTPAATTAPAIAPEVDIWAVPASVPLGSRASIYWRTKGVASCTETSPDGSFSQNTLSNFSGASTVPITGPTTFTISCLTPNGSHVTDYVTVKVGI